MLLENLLETATAEFFCPQILLRANSSARKFFCPQILLRERFGAEEFGAEEFGAEEFQRRAVRTGDCDRGHSVPD
jgi:hypothetical protein